MFSPNNLAIAPSYILSTLLWLPHIAALSLVLSSTAPVALMLVACVIMSMSGWYAVAMHGLLRLPGSVLQVHMDRQRDADSCQLLLRDGRCVQARILDDTVVTASFVLLRLQPETSCWTRTLIITRWNSEPEPFRRLRVLLRFKRATDASSSTSADEPATADKRAAAE